MHRVLIVDDNALVRTGLKVGVDWAAFGMETPCVCETAEEAVAMLVRNNYDVALIDIRLPGMSGLDLIRQMHQAGMQTEIVVISAYSEFEFAQKCVELGVRQYLLKPIGMDELADVLVRVNRCLDERDEISQVREDSQKMRLLQRRLLESYSETIGRHLNTANVPALVEELERMKAICAGQVELMQSGLKEYISPEVQLDLSLDTQMLAAEMMRHSRSLAQDDTEKIARKALVWLKEHYNEELMLADVARRFGLHPSYFSAVLKAECGLAFSNYVLQLRMERARQLLDLDVPTSEVAQQVGYKNYKSFYKTFRSFFGHAPSEK